MFGARKVHPQVQAFHRIVLRQNRCGALIGHHRNVSGLDIALMTAIVGRLNVPTGAHSRTSLHLQCTAALNNL
jgi:hypothetical protein